MKMSAFPLGFFLLTIAGCAANPPPTLPGTQLAAQAQIQSAAALAANKQYAEAETTIQPVIHAKNFGQLPSPDQYQALKLAAKLAFTLKHTKLEYESRVRLMTLPEATEQDRRSRVNAAARLGDTAEMVIALTAVAQKDTDRLNDIDDEFIFRVLRDARKKLPPAARQPLLQSLYSTGWKLKFGTEPSYEWVDLALMLLEQNKLKEAIDVTSHVTDEYMLIAMRADHRFDPVIAANPAQYDVDAAVKRQLEHFQSAMEQHPKSLAAKIAVIDLLLEQQHYAASLALADSVLAEVQSNSNPKQWYEEYDRQYVWILDNRSRDLIRLGRRDEAVAQLTAASLIEEESGGNVSQVINLGDLYCELMRPTDALDALNRLGVHISPYGRMQAESVRLTAAVQLGDVEQTAKSLSYITEHRADAPLTYQYALLMTHDDDAPAKWLIERLKDKDQRMAALLSIQEYALPPQMPQETAVSARQRAMIARPDVQAAIKQVGRIERYTLEALQQ